jgi:hypothetical protein
MTSAHALLTAAFLLIASANPDLASAQGPGKSDGAARAHFQKAEKAFNGGIFDEALAAYQAAYEAKPLPGFLFNIAQCHRNLGDHERALFFYRRYLALEPETPNRSLVEQLMAEAEKGSAVQPPATATRPPPVEAPPVPSIAVAPPPEKPAVMLVTTAPVVPPGARSLHRRWWFWATVGSVAAAGVATALVIGGGHGPSAGPTGSLSTINWR